MMDATPVRPVRHYPVALLETLRSLSPRDIRDSTLGVRGLLEVYRSGRVALANAPGTGIADDKAVYTFVPDLIRYYLSEEPLLPNVTTYRCGEPGVLEQVTRDAERLVIKEVGGAGASWLSSGRRCCASPAAMALSVSISIAPTVPRWCIGSPSTPTTTVRFALASALRARTPERSTTASPPRPGRR